MAVQILITFAINGQATDQMKVYITPKEILM